ncbi:Uncharacterised protein [Klebsiella pneumoniae]|nr:Uncharacterised protein [Klebsiella pneumoniae]
MVFRRRCDGSGKIVCRIAGDQALLYRVAHDRRDALLEPRGGLQIALSLRHPQRDQQIGGFQVGNGDFANQWKYVQLQRAQGFSGVCLRPADIACHPFTGDFFKGVAAFLCLLLLLLFYPRIVTRAEYGAGFLTQLTRIRQRNGWVSAKRQLLLLPAKAVLELPELRAVGFNQQVQTLRVAGLVRRIARLGIPDGGIGI